MKSITIKNLHIQFDADQVTSGSDAKQARVAIDLINGVLQRTPYGLAAQVLNGWNISAADIEVEIDDEDDDDDNSWTEEEE